jgi:TM2 domain-containing membrane protein YozV
MQIIDSIYTANMNDHQRAWFYAEQQRASKDEVVGVLFALFLGGLGIHHFYLRQNGLGLLYLFFSWTGIPMILGWIECFFMPARVRRYNATQAAFISSQILASGQPAAPPSGATQCPSCGSLIGTTAAFCTRCGAAITRSPLTPQTAL